MNKYVYICIHFHIFFLVSQIQIHLGGTVIPDLANVTLTGDSVEVAAAYKSAFYVMLIQIFAAYICYIFGKFACKILIQGFSYAFPINLVIPVVVNILIAACGIRNGDNCFFHGSVPDYLYFESPPGKYLFLTILLFIIHYIYCNCNFVLCIKLLMWGKILETGTLNNKEIGYFYGIIFKSRSN